ncbi:hypothetical protein [Sphaerisporangium perillae]|uniref:hypothetical protein n=1 Tax=Sphaerisporangium perillae TaxID=2935860 RepID=UPI00200BD70F|nr:hypothetical protein [Sphaerisporangium perillae]
MEALAPYLFGVDLVPLVPLLDVFSDKRSGAWSIRLRRPLIEITGSDADLLRRKLAAVAAAPSDVIPDCLANIVGRTMSQRQWHPRDGRIVELGLHCRVDPMVGNNVTIAIEAATIEGASPTG